MQEIKFNHQALNKLLDDTMEEGVRKGLMLAIDALRNQSFQSAFDLDRLESEICAEALFTHREELLR